MARAHLFTVLGLVCATSCSSLHDAISDAVSLVQRSSAEAPSMVVSETEPLGPMKLTSAGPIAYTELGAILGQEEDDHFAFRGIPYAEAPRRFEKAVAKNPWSPRRLVAKQYKTACIGSGTDQDEGEDCLHLNIWLPKSGQTNMPVVVYFHGGLNMHGSGAEYLRQGDGLVQSAKYPAIFINFDFRLGIFGWLYSSDEAVVSNNLGFFDQREALRWIHKNIAAFGGDPDRVALMGQSEGGSNIMNHLVSPGSAGLFHRAIFHSPPAEIWSDKASAARTEAIVKSSGCYYPDMATRVECLRRIPAETLWKKDWTPEDLARSPFSPKFFSALGSLFRFALGKKMTDLPASLGWHLFPTGDTVPRNVHDLISSGNWSKVPILVTISKNESYGIVPGDGAETSSLRGLLGLVLGGDVEQSIRAYEKTLLDSGIGKPTEGSLMHQMITDKLFTCEAWALAEEVTRGGGSVQLGLFWHTPRFDPVGTLTNKICAAGATCHAAEMLYSLPQGHNRGIPEYDPELREEVAFAHRYRDEVLSFVHGNQGPWEPYRPGREVATFYDRHGARVEKGYRKKQCAVLDRSMPDFFPEHMRRRADP